MNKHNDPSTMARSHKSEIRKTILIVENDPAQVFCLIDLLEINKVDVLCAPGGRSGVIPVERDMQDVLIFLKDTFPCVALPETQH